MTIRVKPFLTTGVALASAATIAVASPAMAPDLTVPTPVALSKAAYELTTFADVFTVPADVWTDALFGTDGYGGVLGFQNLDPETERRGGYGPDWARPVAGPWGGGFYYTTNSWAGNCAYTCFEFGWSATLYIFLDALVNGTGNGWDDYDNWAIGPVNYLFEPFTVNQPNAFEFDVVQQGVSATLWYLLRGTLGEAIPIIQTPLDLAFYGVFNLTFAYENVWRAVAGLTSLLPLVGGFVSNSITAYLGELLISYYDPQDFVYYPIGPTGTLNYWVNLLTGAEPWPASASGGLLQADPAATVAAEVTAATEPAADAADSTIVAADAEAGPAEAGPAEAGPAESVAAEAVSAEAVEATEAEPPTEVVPAIEVDPAIDSVVTEPAPVETPEQAIAESAPVVTPVDIPAVADSTPSTPAAGEAAGAPRAAAGSSASPRPVRDAVKRAAKSITSAVGGNRSARAGADNASSAERATSAASAE